MKKLAKKVINLVFSALPETTFFDKAISYVNFFRAHQRIPSKKESLINDIFFFIKTSDEILNPVRTFTSDKFLVKSFIKSVVGDRYNVPTIAILNSFNQIDSYDFPSSCCIKPTHASGRFIIRSDGEDLDIELIKSWLNTNYYKTSRERNYKYLQPQIIIEPLIYNSTNIQDYKFFCNNKEPKFIQVDSDRAETHTRCFYNTSWQKLNFSMSYPLTNHEIQKPNCFEEMLDVSKKIAEYFNIARVDFYTDGLTCMIGEITHCPESSNGRFIPKDAEYEATKLFLS